jgi:RimJ/RimL family protein N-acetyltransferase
MAEAPRTRRRNRGEVVYLRPLEPDDLPALHRWGQDGEYARFTGEPPRSLEDWRRRYERLHAEQGDTLFQFAICRLEDDLLVGHISLFEIDRLNGSAAFGIAIGEREHWSRGYGTDAVNVIVDFGFGDLRLERIWLGTAADNVRAQRSYEKAGFTVEARLRRSYVDRGNLIDEIRMSMLRAEWAALTRRKSWEYEAG